MENNYELRKQLIENLYAFKKNMKYYSIQQLKKFVLYLSSSFYASKLKEYAIDLIIQKAKEEDTNEIDENEFLYDLSYVIELIEKLEEIEKCFTLDHFDLGIRIENILLRNGYSSLLNLEDITIEELASLRHMNLSLLTNLVNIMIEQGIWDRSKRNELEKLNEMSKRGN